LSVAKGPLEPARPAHAHFSLKDPQVEDLLLWLPSHAETRTGHAYHERPRRNGPLGGRSVTDRHRRLAAIEREGGAVGGELADVGPRRRIEPYRGPVGERNRQWLVARRLDLTLDESRFLASLHAVSHRLGHVRPERNGAEGDDRYRPGPGDHRRPTGRVVSGCLELLREKPLTNRRTPHAVAQSVVLDARHLGAELFEALAHGCTPQRGVSSSCS